MPEITLPLCCRIDADDMSSRNALLSDGWRDIELLQVWVREAEALDIEWGDTIVDMASKSALKSCVWIASTSFTHDRLHKDPQVPDAVADRQKMRFVEAAFTCSEKAVYVAKDGKTVQGFVIVTADDEHCTIDLIAVDRRHRKKGVARKLIAHLSNVYKPLMIVAGTQSTNKPAQALYHSAGFICHQTCRTMHK